MKGNCFKTIIDNYIFILKDERKNRYENFMNVIKY